MIMEGKGKVRLNSTHELSKTARHVVRQGCFSFVAFVRVHNRQATARPHTATFTPVRRSGLFAPSRLERDCIPSGHEKSL